MPLIIAETSLFDVQFFIKEEGDKLLFSDETKEGYDLYTFTFKKPDWSDNREIISRSMNINSNGLSINPWLLVDLRMKLLLRQWSLKNAKGKMVPITEENVNALHPSLVDYLNDKLNEIIEDGGGIKTQKTSVIPPVESPVVPEQAPIKTKLEETQAIVAHKPESKPEPVPDSPEKDKVEGIELPVSPPVESKPESEVTKETPPATP